MTFAAGHRPSNAYPEEVVTAAARLRMRDGRTNREIADTLGIPVRTIYHWMGATPRRIGGQPYWPVGMRERARYLRGCGYEVREIAEQIGVPRSTVGDWVAGMPCDL